MILLALLDAQILGACGESSAEAFQCLGELEVGLGVVAVQRRSACAGLAGSPRACVGRGAGAQLVERDELLLIAVEQPLERGSGRGEVALERVPTAGWPGVWRASSGSRRSISAWIRIGSLEQSEDPGPDELVQAHQADGPVSPDASFGAAGPSVPTA